MLAISANGAIGNGALLLVLASSVLGALATGVALVTGNVKAIRQAGVYAALIVLGAVAAVLAMQIALQQRDYSIDYIQQVGSRTTPPLYNVAAMWSALEGSILLWMLVLAGFTGAVAWRFRKRADDALVGWALVVMYVVCIFFALVSFGPANPFAAGPVQPIGFDGRGPNPLLQNHILVLFHPPILYLGYVGFTVPFAFAIAALITGPVGEGWLMDARPCARFSLGFLTLGGRNILVPSPRPVQNLQRAVENYPITWITGVNTLYNGLLNEEWFVAYPPKHLKASIAGGAALHDAVAQRWREVTQTPIAEGYGLTETSPVVSFNPLSGDVRLGSIGVPSPGTDVRLVQDDGQDAPVGQAGEIWVRGPQVMPGYWNNPTETALVLKDGWFATGDIGVMSADGFFTIVDRKKDMVLVSGFNVYPNEVEEVIAQMDAVLEVAVIGVPPLGLTEVSLPER